MQGKVQIKRDPIRGRITVKVLRTKITVVDLWNKRSMIIGKEGLTEETARQIADRYRDGGTIMAVYIQPAYAYVKIRMPRKAFKVRRYYEEN